MSGVPTYISTSDVPIREESSGSDGQKLVEPKGHHVPTASSDESKGDPMAGQMPVDSIGSPLPPVSEKVPPVVAPSVQADSLPVALRRSARLRTCICTAGHGGCHLSCLVGLRQCGKRDG